MAAFGQDQATFSVMKHSCFWSHAMVTCQLFVASEARLQVLKLNPCISTRYVFRYMAHTFRTMKLYCNLAIQYVLFLALKAAIADDNTENQDASRELGSSSPSPLSDACSESDLSELREEGCDKQEDISGNKCRVPFSHVWGEMTYHNAMVLCAEPTEEGVEAMV